MIKKFKLYILLAAMAFSAASCLDKMPEDGIPFDESIQTVDDVNLAVIGIYDAFKSSALYSAGRPCVWGKWKYEYIRRYLALERHSGN